MRHRFTEIDVGCFADGAQGHRYVRHTLADLVDSLGDAALAKSLRNYDAAPDDLSDEDAALDLLHEHTAPGLVWGFVDGDLMLLTDEEN
jgi:hypothetical protein